MNQISTVNKNAELHGKDLAEVEAQREVVDDKLAVGQRQAAKRNPTRARKKYTRAHNNNSQPPRVSTWIQEHFWVMINSVIWG